MNARETPAATPTRNWKGVLCPDPPPMRDRWDALYLQAAKSLATRVQRYPRMIDLGQIERETAEAEITIWRAIKMDWIWIITGTGQKLPKPQWPAAIAQLEQSLDTLIEIARETESGIQQGTLSPDLAREAHNIIALLYHYQELNDGRLGVHFAAACNHDHAALANITPERRWSNWGLPLRNSKTDQVMKEAA